ncbi:MAG: hypothetical protein ACR2GR_04955, partial [Rhodothermales bacterium]
MRRLAVHPFIFFYATALLLISLVAAGCTEFFPTSGGDDHESVRTSAASYPDLVTFSSSRSSSEGVVYEVLPGPSAIDPSLSPTPFSNNVSATTGSYAYAVRDVTPTDAEDSEDAVTSVDITFQGNDGRTYQIDQIEVIHKAAGTGEHPFFGGVGLNKVIHGDTGIGTPLEPKLLAYVA